MLDGVLVAALAVASSATRFESVRLSDLVVTSGAIESSRGMLALRAPSIRATVGSAPRRAIEASFTYRGPSVETVPLASGEVRRQIGLKLRARDTCNVVYVMWHVAPTVGVHVSVKSNPDAHDHAACGDGGYVQLASSLPAPTLRAIATGERRVLAATQAGDELRVEADGVLVWRGSLPAAALAFDGPVGLRSDNGQFDLALRVGPPLATDGGRP